MTKRWGEIEETLGTRHRAVRRVTTTLRHYSHAVALHDEDVADDLDQLLDRPS